MKNSIIILKTNSNSPFLSFFKVIEESEKAIKVQNTEAINKIGWLPKSALKQLGNKDEFTFKTWFRKINNGNSITKAFNLF